MIINYSSTSRRNDNDVKIIQDGLRVFNQPHFGEKPIFNAVYARDQEGLIIGGAITYIAADEMLLDTLWVHENYRKEGIGREILQKVMKIAKNNKISTVFTDTYSFQAEGFYLKQGFQVYGRVDGYLAGHSKIYLKKILKGIKK